MLIRMRNIRMFVSGFFGVDQSVASEFDKKFFVFTWAVQVNPFDRPVAQPISLFIRPKR